MHRTPLLKLKIIDENANFMVSYLVKKNVGFFENF